MNRWGKIALGEIASFRNGLNFTNKSHGVGYKIIGVPDFGDRIIPDYQTLGEINPEGIVKKDDFLEKGDIIFVRSNGNKDLVGRSLLINRKIENLVYSGFCIRARFITKSVSPLFYAYFFRTNEFRRLISAAAGGANIQNLNQGILSRAIVPLPPLETQIKIASILCAYDDLIDNNLKRIKLLEELAQHTYEEWFVKFRINGQQLEVNPEFGLPKGWERLPFEDVIDFKEGPGLRNTQYREEGVPFLNIRVIKDNEVDFSKIQYLNEEEVNKKYPHFLLKEDDHVISTSGTLGRIVTIRAKHLPLCLNTSLIRMRPISDQFGKWLIKHYISNQRFKNIMESFANGSAQVNFGPIHLKQIKIEVPPTSIAKAYETLVAPIEEKIKILKDTNILLKEARDILLPRLMNGSLSIEKSAEELALVADL